MKTWWIHRDKKHRYYTLRDDTIYFILSQEHGSLSGLITYDSKEDAIKDGWKEVSE